MLPGHTVGEEIITSLKEAIARSRGEKVPVRVTTVAIPAIDVCALRRRLGLSQSEFELDRTVQRGCCWP